MKTQTEQNVSIRKNTLVATSAIMGSRILGLVREKAFAFFFGAGFAYDAFLVAFRIPNLLRDLLAEGALSQAFTTVFAQLLGKNQKDKADVLANQIITFVFVVVSFLVTLGIIFAPEIMHGLAAGFSETKLALTIRLSRLLFTFILFASLAAVYMGMLNAHNKFFIPQSASTFFNLTSIFAGLGFVYLWAPTYFHAILNGKSLQIPVDHPEGLLTAITAMALGTLLGGLVQWLIQLPLLLKIGYRPFLNFNWKDRNFIKVMRLTGPSILAGAAVQVNVLVNQHFASFLGDGAVSYLGYAFRFMQFPLGVFGVAVAIASGPTLAKLISQNRKTDFQITIRKSIEMSLFLSVPAAVGLFFLSDGIIGLIYEGGQFDVHDTLQTSYALMAYTFGISFYSLIKIYQPAYLAFHDSKTPMIISLFSILVNFSVNWTFIHIFKWPHWSLALGTSIVATLNFVLLSLFFRKKMKRIWSSKHILQISKILMAALLMGALLYFTKPVLKDLFFTKSLWNHMIYVLIFVLIGSLSYFGLCLIFQVEETKIIFRRFLKK